MNKNYKIIAKPNVTTAYGKAVMKMPELPDGDVIFIAPSNDGGMWTAAYELASQKLGLVKELYDISTGTEVPITASGIANTLGSVGEYNHSCHLTEIDGAGNFVITLNVEMLENAIGDTKIEAYADDIDKVVAAGILSKPEAEEKVEWMVSNRLPETLIRKVISLWDRCDKVKKPKTLYVDTEPKSKTASVATRAMYYKVLNQHLIFEGEKSCGKNVMIESLCWALNVPYYMDTMGRQMCLDDMYGTKKTAENELMSLDKQELEDLTMSYIMVKCAGESDFEVMQKAARFEELTAKAASVNLVQEVSEFVGWILDPNPYAVYVPNEMNLADANFLSKIFNQVLDGTGFVYCPGFGRLTIPKTKTIIATQNNGDTYLGIGQQNEATMSRLSCIVFPMAEKVSPQLKAMMKGRAIDEAIYTNIDKFWHECKEVANNANSTKSFGTSVLNIRGLGRALEAFSEIPGLIDIKTAINEAVINTCPLDERSFIVSTLAKCMR